MHRTIIQLTDKQKDSIAKLSSDQNISQSALIRQAVEEFIQKHAQVTKATDDVFGIWKGRGINSLKYQDELRQEWE